MIKSNKLNRVLFAFICFVLMFVLVACTNADKKAANEVDEAILAVSDIVTLDDEAAIVAARNAYEKLTDKQKDLVENLEDLEIMEGLLQDLLAIKSVVDLIAAIPAAVTLNEASKINAARTAYDALGSTLKPRVTNYQKLQSAEAIYDDLVDTKERVDAVIALITALPTVLDLTLEDRTDVVAANVAFGELTDLQQAKVTNANKLTALLARITDLQLEKLNQEAAAIVDDLIAAISDEVTAQDQADIEAARDAYDALNDDQKILVTKLDDLVAAEDRLVMILSVQVIIDLIDFLPDKPILEDELDFIYARESYDALSKDLQDLVTNYDELESKEAELEAVRVEVDIVYELNGGTWTWTAGPVTNAEAGIAADSNLPVFLMQDIFYWLDQNNLLDSDIIDPGLVKLTWEDFSASYKDPVAIYNWGADKTDGGLIADVAGYNQFFYDMGSGDSTTGKINKLIGGFFGSEEYGPKYATLVQHLSYLVFDRNYGESYKLFWGGANTKTASGFILDGYLYGTQGLAGRNPMFIALRGAIPTPFMGYKYENGQLIEVPNPDFVVVKKAIGAKAVLSVPSKEGYFFGGWYDNPECNGNRIIRIQPRVAPAEKYYAKWIAVG